MERDHRTRRLTDTATPPQQTPEPPPSTSGPPVPVDAPDLLEPPPPQHAAARLEERQKRWFQRREIAVKSTATVPASAPDSEENPASDPKG